MTILNVECRLGTPGTSCAAEGSAVSAGGPAYPVRNCPIGPVPGVISPTTLRSGSAAWPARPGARALVPGLRPIGPYPAYRRRRSVV